MMGDPEEDSRPVYEHLTRLTTDRGLFEHARHDVPRPEHGYCVDDVARALVVTVREPDQTPALAMLTETYLTFLESAVAGDGRVHNRMDTAGGWSDRPGLGDWWGRAIGGLGYAVAHAADPFQRTRAAYAFARAASRRSDHGRASAFAAIGAAEVLRGSPDADSARRLLADALSVLPLRPSSDWEWPEARMRYANAALCEALIAGGDALGRRDLVDRGLELLLFLLAVETGPSGDLSVTGSGGRGPGQSGPLWDQQGIEPAAIAAACSAASAVDPGWVWTDGVRRAWAWFTGANDHGIPLYDATTGAGYDGLHSTGRNENRGAESTIAALNTLQLARAHWVTGRA